MSDSIQVTVELIGETHVVTAEVTTDSVLPKHIFIYENTGESTLGDYKGVANLAELKRLSLWKDEVIPRFGNRFVRYDQAKITLPLGADVDSVVNNLVSTAKSLKKELQADTSTTATYQI